MPALLSNSDLQKIAFSKPKYRSSGSKILHDIMPANDHLLRLQLSDELISFLLFLSNSLTTHIHPVHPCPFLLPPTGTNKAEKMQSRPMRVCQDPQDDINTIFTARI